jgi:hypothetical protein
MRKVGLLLLLTALLAVPAMGQDEYPKAEIFGGFSYGNLSTDGTREGFYGWQASAAGNFHKNVGIVADFGGQYKSIEGVRVSTYEYLVGPRFYYRQEKATVFAHALFGGARIGAGAGGVSVSSNGFAMGYGGGVDVKINDRVAFRVFQVDYMPTRFEGVWQKSNVRLGVGIVFTSGK